MGVLGWPVSGLVRLRFLSTVHLVLSQDVVAVKAHLTCRAFVWPRQCIMKQVNLSDNWVEIIVRVILPKCQT